MNQLRTLYMVNNHDLKIKIKYMKNIKKYAKNQFLNNIVRIFYFFMIIILL